MNPKRLLARLVDEEGGYVADIPDLEACSAFGTTAEEALAGGRALSFIGQVTN